MPIYIKRLLVFCLFILFALASVWAQDFIVKGRVVDADSKEPLAFVNILSNDGPAGTATDIDGKFTIRDNSPVTRLKLSYVGYEPLVVMISQPKNEQFIRLQKKELELEEVVIKPGINPANRIIRSVLENRFLNDHEHMESFAYSTYEKITFGPEIDTIPWSDSIARDTSSLQMKEFFDKQHLFMMESVTERKFMFPDKNYNKVIASRVSGFGDPLFVFLMSQMQSTSFYRETVTISDKQYINPISSGTLSKYYFEIYDTLVEPWPYDTTYIMTFRPLMKTNFDGLKGVISISTNGFAIRNVIAEPARVTGSMTIKIQQLYDYVQNEHWFPLQLNTDIIFNDALGKGSVSIGVGNAPDNPGRSDLIGRGKSYISAIRLNPPFRRSEFGFVEVDVQPDAFRQPAIVWDQYRHDSLSLREINTYRILDSIGEANHFDRLGYRLDAILNGKIPAGIFNLELDKIGHWNRYEGLRLGMGLHTNDRFSRVFQLGGYGAYGFKDTRPKYCASAQFMISRLHDSKVRFLYQDDLSEAGFDDPFLDNRMLINAENYRKLLVSRMDHFTLLSMGLGSRLLNYAYVELMFQRARYKPLYEYGYLTHRDEDIEVYSGIFDIDEVSLKIRYAYGEKFVSNSRSVISMGTKYPVVWLNYGRGIKGWGIGQYSYNRLNLKVQKTFSLKYLGKTSLTLSSGWIDNDVPYPLLYNALSDYAAFSVYSSNSFATMRMGEFVADRYAALFLSHNFTSLLYRSKHFNPQPEIICNIGFGSLSHPENHKNINAKGYEKGYYESGLLLNNMLNFGFTKIGLGAFYRYGHYSLPNRKDNIAYKLTLGFII